MFLIRARYRLAAALLFASLLGIGIFFAAVPPAQTAEPSLTREEIEKIVHDYLVAHPEILTEMISELESRDRAAAEKSALGAIAEHRKMLDDDGYSFVAGNPKGDVTVVEFFDYNCGYCKQVRPSVVALLESDPNVRLVLKEFPILGPTSVIATRAAMAAQKQGAVYWDYHNKMLAHEGRLDEATIFALAGEAGLDVARLKADMEDPAIAERISRTEELARKIGVDGTPSFVIGDKLAGGAEDLDGLKALVAAARAKCETCRS
ncbi:MAG: DsbA family protein [Alphaproteobacteria bacterium]|nr:DsbA family protein [Alphaproteobacteria bacterium]